MAIFGNKARAAALCVAILIVLYGTTEVAPIRAAYSSGVTFERAPFRKIPGTKPGPYAARGEQIKWVQERGAMTGFYQSDTD